jgi:hypothetical protein
MAAFQGTYAGLPPPCLHVDLDVTSLDHTPDQQRSVELATQVDVS